MSKSIAAVVLLATALLSGCAHHAPAQAAAPGGVIVADEDDALPGFTVDYAEIDDPRVVDLSGNSVHPIVRSTGNTLDKVTGKVLWVTENELDAADEYEVELYRRVEVSLQSGRAAWVYVSV